MVGINLLNFKYKTMKLSAFDLLALTQFTVQEKRAMMAFVMGSAWADGHLDYREEQAVEDIASLLKMTEYDMQQIEQNFTPEKSEIILKKMDNIKKIFFGKMVATVIMADGVVDEKEEFLLATLVEKLNIPMS